MTSLSGLSEKCNSLKKCADKKETMIYRDKAFCKKCMKPLLYFRDIEFVSKHHEICLQFNFLSELILFENKGDEEERLHINI